MSAEGDIEPVSSGHPEEMLRCALESRDAEDRERYARAGLAYDGMGLDPDTHVLLLRQLYRALLERGKVRLAADVARRAAAIGPLSDVLHHDAARALHAVGDDDRAIGEQRLAVRRSAGSRRSFHLWSLATLQHQAGRPEDALRTLRRAMRWAGPDRALLRAHAAFIELDAGGAPEQLAEIVSDLERSPSRTGYGELLLGLIAHSVGDGPKAVLHLRAFLRRHAGADPRKLLTLRDEIARARAVLARHAD